jgi:hypothetical protein
MRARHPDERRAAEARSASVLLAYTEQVTDEDGAPMGNHATEVRVDPSSIPDRTRMVTTHTGIASDSPGAAGWQMAFDKLAALLRSPA